MQFITFMRARDERDPTAFQKWYLGTCGPQLLGRSSKLRRFLVNLAHQGPEELRRPSDSTDPRARYDLVTQMWFDTIPEAKSTLDDVAVELSAWADQRYSYGVSDTVVLDRRVNHSGSNSGIKVMRGIFFFDDMPNSAARRSWTLHARLALKVHVGMSSYVQHWVEEKLSPNAPAIRGISELYFASRDDLVERYYDSERGRDEILQDTSHFIQDQLPRVYATEYVLRT